MLVTHVIKATGFAGAEAHLLTLLPALREFGIDSELVVLAEPNREPTVFLDAARAAGIAACGIPIYFHADPTLAGRLAEHLRAAPPDIVHTHLIHADLHGAMATSISNRQSLISSRHNDDRFRRHFLVKALNRAAMRRAKKIIAISDAVAKFVVEVEGAPREKVTRIHYGLDAENYMARARPGSIRSELGLDDSIPVAAFVGRLTAQKGVETLLSAWRAISARIPSAHLLISGDGELRESLVTTYPLPLTNYHFLGWRSDIPSLMSDCDVLVVPSLWEGFGMVTLEAMAARKPVIASRVSALPEIVVDGETGYLVPSADPERLSQSIIAVLSDRDRAREMGMKGRERLEREFSVEKMAEGHAQEYREA